MEYRKRKEAISIRTEAASMWKQSAEVERRSRVWKQSKEAERESRVLKQSIEAEQGNHLDAEAKCRSAACRKSMSKRKRIRKHQPKVSL